MGPTPVTLEELALFRNAHVVDMFLLIAHDREGVRGASDDTKFAEMPPEIVRVPRNGR